MSVGGARFSLGLALAEFKKQFTQAEAVAASGSADIGRQIARINEVAEQTAQQVYNNLNRALGRGGATGNLREFRDAVNSSREALKLFGSGDVVGGFDRLQASFERAQAALAKINTITEQLNKSLGGPDDAKIRDTISFLTTQATTLQNALNSISRVTQSSLGSATGINTRAEAEERQQTERAIAAIQRQNIDYQRAAEQQLADEERQRALAARVIQQQTVAYVKAAEQQAEDEKRAREQALQNLRKEWVQELANQQAVEDKIRNERLYLYQRAAIQQMETARTPVPTGPSALGQAGSAILTGLGIGSGVQVAITGIQQVERLLGQMKKGVVDFNDQLDQSTIAWTVFTGSAEKASAQVNLLFDFAKRTPFTFEDVDEAARLLAAFGGASFASAQNLRLLGDVAAGTKKPLNQITYEFGQMYSEIENGLPFGRAARALVQFGALTGEARVRMEEMQKAGVDASKILEVLYKDLDRFSGNLEKQSKTFSGALTTLKDNLESLEAIAGRPAFDRLKEAINSLNNELNKDSASKFAENVAAVLLIIEDEIGIIVKSVQVVGQTFQVAFDAVIRGVATAMLRIVQIMNTVTRGAFADQENELKLFVNRADDMVTAGVNNIADRFGEIGGLFGKIAEDANYKASARRAGQSYGDAWRDGLQQAIDQNKQAISANAALAGLTASREFLNGFTKEDYSSLGDLADIVSNAILGAKAKGKLKGDAESLIGEVRPLLVQAVDDIKQYGKVADGTFTTGGDTLGAYTGDVQQLHNTLAALKNALPPEAFQAVQEYLNGLERLDTATTNYNFAVAHLAAMQKEYAQVQDDVKKKVQDAQDAYDKATRSAEENSRKNQKIIDDLHDNLDAAQESARNSSQQWEDSLNSLRGQLDDLRTAADANAKKFADMLAPLQEKQKQLQDAERQHSEAYKAILEGTTQEYIAQNEQLDEQTKKIIDKWEAEIGGKRRSMEGADQKVSSLEVKERAELLALEERIRAARAGHRPEEVSALEQEKKRLQDRYNYQLDIERQRAAVAKDQFDAASKGVKKEADAQEAKDKKAIDANKREIDAITAQAKAQKEKDDAAIAAKEQEIKQQEKLAAEAKRAHDDEINSINEQIKLAEHNKKIQEEKDKEQTQAAKDHLDEVKKQGDLDLDYAKKKKDEAQKAADAAKDQVTHEKGITDAIKDRLQWIQKENELYLDRINAWRLANGDEPLTWGQIQGAAGNPGGDVPGARGIGEGRGPQFPDTPVTPPPAKNPPKNQTSPGVGPTALRINPSVPMSALTLPASAATQQSDRINGGMSIGNLSLFANSTITKDVDAEKWGRMAGQEFLREVRGEIASGGPRTRTLA